MTVLVILALGGNMANNDQETEYGQAVHVENVDQDNDDIDDLVLRWVTHGTGSDLASSDIFICSFYSSSLNSRTIYLV